LKCERVFESHSLANRICEKCKRSEEFRFGENRAALYGNIKDFMKDFD